MLGPRPPADGARRRRHRDRPLRAARTSIANRLDPWHGAWFHPYSFTALRVLTAPPIDCPPAEDRFLVEVTFTVGKRFGVPVYAEFSCPDPRTVTMEIVDGEGAGTVVETHATPLRPDADGPPAHRRDRGRGRALRPARLRGHPPGRGRAAAAGRATAARLWRDDIAYAERRYALRATGLPPAGSATFVSVQAQRRACSGSGARRPRNVCTMCCCQPGNVCTARRRTPWRAAGA